MGKDCHGRGGKDVHVRVPPGTIVYDARFPERFGVIEHRPPCSHQRSVKSGDFGVGAVDWSQR